MPRKITRRGMLYSLGATGAATAIGAGSATGDPGGIPPEHANGRGSIDFDPGDLDQIRRFMSTLETANESARENIIDGLDDDQTAAFRDANKQAYTARTTTNTVEQGGEAYRTSVREISVDERNADIPRKWGWDVDTVSTSPTDSDVVNRSQEADRLAASTQSYGWQHGSQKFCHTVENSTWVITRFEWEHCLEWDWSYYRTPYGDSESSIDNVRVRPRVVDTGLGWTYHGVIHGDTYTETSNRGDEYVYSEQEAKFTYYDTIDSMYPHIDLRGSYRGNGQVVSESES